MPIHVIMPAFPPGSPVLYLDDRDLLDLDEDAIAGGLWIYRQSNGVGGLQRGGDTPVFTIVNPDVPFVSPIPIFSPNPGGLPIFPNNGLTLFPEGFGGGSASETAWQHDDCFQGSDTLLFGSASPSVGGLVGF